MYNVLKKWGAIFLAPLIVWCFLPGFQELWQTYSNFWLFENALAAGVIVLLYVVAVWKYELKKSKNEENFPGLFISFGILSICGSLLVNNYLGGFQVLPPILAYCAVYCWLGFWLKPSFWKRSAFVFMLFILTLPVLERLQKFVGFPLRLVTAKIVSFLLQLVGVGNISNSTVIMTENYATTIDLPCSGVKSLYFGGIILLAVYFLQQIKLSIKSIILAFLFFALLVFFNIWRVFGLVYVYGVLHLLEAGDSIHVFLGITGFVVSCLFLWYGSDYVKKTENSQPKFSRKAISFAQIVPFKGLAHVSKWFNQGNTATICAITLIVTGVLTNTYIKKPDKKIAPIEQSISFSIPNTVSSVVPFSEKEKTLFLNTDVTFASKYALKWKQKDLNLLLVRSTSARSHHDPELCLQGLGYRLLHEQTILFSDAQIKEIEIQTSDDPHSPTGEVYYWYVSKDTIITDYSERVWEQFRQPNQEWVLVELIISKSQQPTKEKLNELFKELTTSVRRQLL